jgi:hypothetical protein
LELVQIPYNDSGMRDFDLLYPFPMLTIIAFFLMDIKYRKSFAEKDELEGILELFETIPCSF